MTKVPGKSRSLFRCTLKKFVHVSIWEVAIIAIWISAIIAVPLLLGALDQVVLILIDIVTSQVIPAVFVFIANIPWWAWPVIVATFATVMYSFWWCVKQEVTEEALEDKRNVLSLAILDVLTAIVGATVVGLGMIGMSLAMFTVGGILCAIAVVSSVVDSRDSDGTIPRGYPLLRVFTAYYYMRKDERAKAEKTEELQ